MVNVFGQCPAGCLPPIRSTLVEKRNSAHCLGNHRWAKCFREWTPSPPESAGERVTHRSGRIVMDENALKFREERHAVIHPRERDSQGGIKISLRQQPNPIKALRCASRGVRDRRLIGHRHDIRNQWRPASPKQRPRVLDAIDTLRE